MILNCMVYCLIIYNFQTLVIVSPRDAEGKDAPYYAYIMLIVSENITIFIQIPHFLSQ